jgi:hypothetical protein
MADQGRDKRRSEQDQSEYMKRGKGRKDVVGGSGIYPASSPTVPADAEVRTEGDLVRHKGPRQKPTDEQGSKKADESAGSE